MSSIYPVHSIASRSSSRGLGASNIAWIRACVVAERDVLVTPSIARSGALAIARWWTRLAPPSPPLCVARFYRVASRGGTHPLPRAVHRSPTRPMLGAVVARRGALPRAAYPRFPSLNTTRVSAPPHTPYASREDGRYPRPIRAHVHARRGRYVRVPRRADKGALPRAA